MYFPYLRGRQFELIAIRELVQEGLISDKVIPIIEPIKPTSTLMKTVKLCNESEKEIALITNPQVGKFKEEYANLNDDDYKHEYMKCLKDENVICSHIVNEDTASEIRFLSDENFKVEDLLVIHNRSDYIKLYHEYFQDGSPRYNLVPDDHHFRRMIRANKVLLVDRFPKQSRNVDYLDVERDFSRDHLFYVDEGYQGFSDFSIVGSEFMESGFAPMAVAIHIVYFDEKNVLRIKHFVSDSNEDITDPAGKFYEALKKLMTWNKIQLLNTYAIDILKEHYEKETYPGLGSLKKLCIMHHLELVSQFLSGRRFDT